MDIKELLKVFSEAYETLYNNTTEFYQIIENDYVDLFDAAITEDQDFRETVQKAAKEREDIFSSDRECAAIVAAYKIMKRREMLKKIYG